MEKLEQLINLLSEIIDCVEAEFVKIHSGQPSQWEVNQLDVVRLEISELLSFALKGKVFFKYGKGQRMLESTYLITDSLFEYSCENVYSLTNSNLSINCTGAGAP